MTSQCNRPVLVCAVGLCKICSGRSRVHRLGVEVHGIAVHDGRQAVERVHETARGQPAPDSAAIDDFDSIVKYYHGNKSADDAQITPVQKSARSRVDPSKHTKSSPTGNARDYSPSGHARQGKAGGGAGRTATCPCSRRGAASRACPPTQCHHARPRLETVSRKRFPGNHHRLVELGLSWTRQL